MFALVHQMRTRIMTSPCFTGDRILAAILFENTMDRDIERQPTADYLWNVKRVVPFLQGGQGPGSRERGRPADEADARAGVRCSTEAKAKRIFGTKMRSVIKQANAARHQGRRQAAVRGGPADHRAGLVPIVEPEVDIHCPDKAKAEELLTAAILEQLNGLPAVSW